MSYILDEARQNAVNAFLSKSDDALEAGKQVHPQECITACLRLVAPFPILGLRAPDEGLTWPETLVRAASYGLYLSPIFDLSLLRGQTLLLGTHVSTKSEEGHAYLILMDDFAIVSVFDPASGALLSESNLPPLDWTYLAIIYRNQGLNWC